MQSVPLLLRQSLRSSVRISRPSHPIRPSALPVAAGPKALHSTNGEPRRTFSVCLRCQFRTQPAGLFAQEPDKSPDGKAEEEPKKDVVFAMPPPPMSEGSTTQHVMTDAGSSGSPQVAERAPTQEQEGKGKTAWNGTEMGGLPSYIENRRSQFSKQFTEMMDNLQSNVFVAGQRLNDLTGYSSIETLKKNIHDQEERLRAARLRVRSAKDAYADAINRRSASQREVNELLQRKHAWSPVDLERFTHLYRNDHTNEVAENEAQEALSAAEREAEEAAAQLTKNILSRYHEEQVWSDKIRRMSTWGTWGLMGVNVLLFLVFQIAVEPWRRKRLVKGFEEKVIEAIEREKVLNQTPAVAAATVEGTVAASEENTLSTASEASTDTPAPVEQVHTTEPTEEAAVPAETTTTTTTAAAAAAAVEEDLSTPKDTVDGAVESDIPPPLELSPSPSAVDSCRRYLYDLFSDRTVILTQRDLSTVAATSAAAGAAVMGLVIALIRPR
ncbi:hypothetical protein ARAM_001014 [Aspergillus rambellii]|uniref:Sensitive to high expression protein 9, mitochondrial n=1 Tax=Aspergillus rambellii TaxID=308745 RepID=A0A0F8XAB5_9EURO|nr:hypothetical protein ARAM_001014 [Aspergillus rambellii]